MRVIIKKWGNSAAIRIPATVMQAADIQLEDAVDVSEDKGRIILEPVRTNAFDLDDLISGITPTNLHEPSEFGAPQGKEVW
ncbi:MAG: AbrB/MazE/SpoVT family DNA-binding domain-containing protein [Verrucomicrobia bacterium]|nr:AbrB/MazE/SpoVT family DNA-binding domain-containing protein [Verrucomicrobiota bacterium]MBV8279891.1 AbrB/MazE/SpoVT family DNA-binding domain-containing protein [Verrucomicrobiota bacterium]